MAYNARCSSRVKLIFCAFEYDVDAQNLVAVLIKRANDMYITNLSSTEHVSQNRPNGAL